MKNRQVRVWVTVLAILSVVGVWLGLRHGHLASPYDQPTFAPTYTEAIDQVHSSSLTLHKLHTLKVNAFHGVEGGRAGAQADVRPTRPPQPKITHTLQLPSHKPLVDQETTGRTDNNPIIKLAVSATTTTDGLSHEASSMLASGCSSRAGNSAQVEVWGKAAIGDYLWDHVLAGTTTLQPGQLWSKGLLMYHCIQFTFRKGWAVQPSNPLAHSGGSNAGRGQRLAKIEYLVLVLNAHQPSKLATALEWLETIPKLPKLRSVGLVILGPEDCETQWLQKYLDNDPVYKIRFVFLVYNGPAMERDKRVLQWPLGVATYRGFPTLSQLSQRTSRPKHALSSDDGSTDQNDTGAHNNDHSKRSKTNGNVETRKWLCNFYGTVYEHSSRGTLLAALEATPEIASRCTINPRHDWMPKETAETLAAYEDALANSQYTLAPAGLNTECYRWYEAAALGSTPIIEDVTKPAQCGRPATALLKEYGAPFQYVRGWANISSVLEILEAAEPTGNMSRSKSRSRSKSKRLLVNDNAEQTRLWYRNFLRKMRDRFVLQVARTMLGMSDAIPAVQ